MDKREDSDSRYDGSEVDTDENQDDVLIEDVNEGEEKTSSTRERSQDKSKNHYQLCPFMG